MPRVFGYPRHARAVVRRRRDGGFTLLEVLIVIAIIAVLFTISFRMVRGAKERAGIARAKAELVVLTNALEEFKRLYGDYPRNGSSTSMAASTSLFHALAGVYGPRGPEGGVLRGPVLLELSKLSLEKTVDNAVMPPADNAFIDPWGTRYFYFYENAGSGSSWLAAGPVLFSAGPDRRVGALPNSSGVFLAGAQFADENTDNLYAEKLP